ncbi:MAG TPA: efflux RND transporter periplasmic adaptor subunit [Candidatus Hydrogenedentes bacterium]|nr:efflux RND transporter periplasmic adaptor subunit [Candidatus Hydrogenedentota bacterium]
MNSEKNAPNNRRRRTGWRFLAKALALPLALLLGYWYFFTGHEDQFSGTTFTVKRGPMEITVLEGGSIEALESQEIKSEVQGETKILSIVEEGYIVTQADIDSGKVLVSLDSKDLEDKLTEKELDYQNANSALTEARANYDIQVNQNASDIRSASLLAKFARMDFERFMGEEVAGEILKGINLEELITLELTSEEEVPPEGESEGGLEGESTSKPAEVIATPPMVEIDFSKYADPERLGDGEARQKLRKLEDDLMLAQRDVGLSQTDFEGTQRLYDREFVTKNQLDNDEMGLKRKQIITDSSVTAKELFIKYEFPKTAEKYLSDYIEALQKLARAKRLADAKLADAHAKLKSAEERFRLQSRKRDELKDQIEKCTIKAEKPGMVVYGGGEERYWREERIEEGAMIRERQIILTIPDLRQMVANVKVHESYVKRVEKGQKARIRVDAYPNVLMDGEVQKIALLPDAQNRWMNPDIKVYETKVLIHGTYDWLKPGMNAESEIIVEELADVVQVPLQAIVPEKGERVCYVAKMGGPERRVVETGDFNDSMIEIKKGLSAGEDVLLRAPQQPEEEQGGEEGEKGGESGKEKPAKGKKKATQVKEEG